MLTRRHEGDLLAPAGSFQPSWNVLGCLLPRKWNMHYYQGKKKTRCMPLPRKAKTFQCLRRRRRRRHRGLLSSPPPRLCARAGVWLQRRRGTYRYRCLSVVPPLRCPCSVRLLLAGSPGDREPVAGVTEERSFWSFLISDHAHQRLHHHVAHAVYLPAGYRGVRDSLHGSIPNYKTI